MEVFVIEGNDYATEYVTAAFKQQGHNVLTINEGYNPIDFVRDNDVNVTYVDISFSILERMFSMEWIKEIGRSISKIRSTDKKNGVNGNGGEHENNIRKNARDGVYICVKKPYASEEYESFKTYYKKAMTFVE
ncbi:MAG: hypothetical protein JW885_14735 [Deltaproteobacteria bacterium]|nr:hypothetical protein [Candidatus Zymogenaceae bacterium]